MEAKDKAMELVDIFGVELALECIKELKKQVMSFDYGLAVSQNDYLEEVKREIAKL